MTTTSIVVGVGLAAKFTSYFASDANVFKKLEKKFKKKERPIIKTTQGNSINYLALRQQSTDPNTSSALALYVRPPPQPTKI